MANATRDDAASDFEFERPSGVRYGVLAFLGSMSFVLYIDRICISRAAGNIEKALDISHTQMGWVFASFTIAYCLFEVHTGRWGDRFGSRGVLTRIVLWWSAFTALTGAAWGFIPLLVTRFLFGAGEAGAFPNMARVLARWFPDSERGRAQGLIYSLALAGGAFAPVACDWLIAQCGWRWAFVAFGALGVVWVVPFHAWFRDRPRDHPAVNAGELRLLESERVAVRDDVHEAIPWAIVWSSPTIWLLGFVITCTSFNAYFYFSWYPSYLKEGRGLPDGMASRMASLVLAAAAVGSLSGGFLLDLVVWLTGNRRWSRCVLGSTGLAFAGMLSWMSTRIDHPTSAVACTALANFLAMGTMAAWWGAVTEVSGPHVGALFGLLNSMGGVGGAGSPIFMGWFVDHLESQGLSGRAQWDPPFVVVAAVLLAGACGWLFIDSSRAVTAVDVCSPE